MSPILTYGGSNRHELNGSVEDKSRGWLKANCAAHHQVCYIPRTCCVPITVLHWPEPPQPDHRKECQRILVSEWSNHEPPPLHGWHRLYARDERYIKSMINMIYSNCIRLSLRLDRCRIGWEDDPNWRGLNCQKATWQMYTATSTLVPRNQMDTAMRSRGKQPQSNAYIEKGRSWEVSKMLRTRFEQSTLMPCQSSDTPLA